LRRALQQANCN